MEKKWSLSDLHVMRLVAVDNMLKHRNMEEKQMVFHWSNIVAELDKEIEKYINEFMSK